LQTQVEKKTPVQSQMNKLSMVVFSGTVDKLTAVAVMASSAVSMGMDVEIFLTFYGLHSFRKDVLKTNNRFSKDFEEMAGPMTQLMQKKHIPSWYDTLKQAKELGKVKIHACSLMYGIMDLKEGDLDPIVDDQIGAASFLGIAGDSKVTLFI
jgi:peroxiredoxin family protein